MSVASLFTRTICAVGNLIKTNLKMAPKKKSKGSKGGRSSAGIVDGVSMAEMSREQLEGFASRMKKELEREREERNFFQLERDKVLTFWEITRHELEENRASLRNKDREIEDIEEKHQDEIKVYKQKLKLLMYEQHVHLSEVQAENIVSLKIANDEHIKEEEELVKENDTLKQEIVEINMRHIEEINNIRLEHARVMRELKDRFIVDCQVIESKYQKRMEDLRNRMNLKNKVEVAETEARKNKRIAEIIEDHNNAFNNLKEHYNDITVNNLTLIASLKENLLELKEDKQRAEMDLKEVTKENESLKGPLAEARNTVEELTQKMENYHKDKQRLMVLTKRLKHSAEKYKDLQVNYDELKMFSEKMQADLDAMHDEHSDGLVRLQMEHGKKLMGIEHRLRRARETIEEKDAQIARLMGAASADTSIAMAMNAKTEALLAKKNKQIERAWNDLKAVTDKHNELCKRFAATLQDHGIQQHDVFELVPVDRHEYFEGA
ncbi:dynein regulatory complex subunit 4 isoform X2 [Sipha flava]|uniref:Dynein regulatory complex subunit 4 n=1 Tax=Sipha flava TaxID=143950 RepID=A0A2S2QVP6_9HEMI|nr:dynein regulatory complex subunit 4 isoform X2 [Sipha flava]